MMSFEILYHPDVSRRDLPRISNDHKQRIKRSIEAKLASAPEEFGEPLRRTLKGYWKLRVGDYRIVYKVTGKRVIILRIGHRREIYNK
jgi:mRNA interferase RelE/StbE